MNLMLKATLTSGRVHLTEELRKSLANWLVITMQEKCNVKKFFEDYTDILAKNEWGKPTENSNSGAWATMSWNIQMTDDGEETQLLNAFRYLMNAIEIELCEASKKILYSSYEEYVLPNTEHFDV